MTPLALAILCWSAGAAAAVVARRRAVGTFAGVVGAVAGGGAAAFAALHALVGAAPAWSMPWRVPAGALGLRLDALSAVFLLPIGLIGAVCAVYGVAYARRHGPGAGRNGPLAAYNVLLLSMAVVISAADLVLLIVAWELMALSSWALVVGDHRDPAVRRAGMQYLVAGHVATAALLLFALFTGAATGSFAVAALGHSATLPTGILFVLLLVGFGTKAGIVPLHVWLPDAHPAAPSHVSALMSAVMISTGFYGLCRFLPLLGPPPAWWGALFMVLGAAGMIGGILYSITQRDVKRALAYSTVENAGLVTLAMGAGLLGTARHHPVLAGLAWTAALLHLWNHAFAKALLFLGFGAVAQRTGSRDLDAMGGILRRWKAVGALVVLGAAAIASLPGLNIFTGEWLLLRGLFSGMLALGGADRIALIGGVVALAFTGALAVAGFTRLVAVGLLGRPRTVGAADAEPPELAMRLPMALLGAACLLMAAVPGRMAGGLAGAVAVIAPAADLSVAQPALAPLGMLLPGLTALALIVFAVRSATAGRERRREGPTWACGYPGPSARAQYTSTSFADGLTAIMQPLLRRDPPPAVGVLPATASAPGVAWPVAAAWASTTRDRVLTGVFLPLFAAVARAGERLRALHDPRVTRSLVYLVATVLVLLGLLFLPGVTQ
ncbi:MAG TPA: proton-conducting transporter membrane subunit [Gemmatimonadales bacterium]|nr:proton-conducting transporter membrane subunit [Gemmatimonadales bacterium]